MIKYKKIYVLVGMFVLLASSSLPAVSLAPMADTFGEDFSSNFGLVFDLNAQGDPSTNTISTNVQVMQDLGNSSNPKVNPTDSNQFFDQQFFFSNYNVSGVNNIYLALQKMEFNITLNVPVLGKVVTNLHVNGSAPFQTLLQYFQNNGKNVLVANTFRGLVAYTANSTDPTLDSADNSYFGYSFVESHFLDLLNSALTGHGFSAIPQYGFTPIYDPSTNTFGMNYTNYFVVWQKTASTAPSALSAVAGNAFDDVATGANIAAASLFKYLSFTYKVETVSSNSTTTVVKVVTNYDLGPMEWLITGDDVTTLGNIQTASSGSINSSNSFNIASQNLQFNIPNYAIIVPIPTLSFYTGTAVEARVDASALQSVPGVHGMGIAIASSTNAVVLGSTVTAPTETTNSQDINIPLSFGSNTFFKTDFSGKSTYTRTLNNGTPETNNIYISTRSMANLGTLLDTSNLASPYFQLQSIQTLGTALYSLDQLNSGFTSSDKTNLQVDHTSYVTFVQMPKWSGLQVTQDPSFSAVSTTAPTSSSGTSGTSVTSTSSTLTSGVPGFEFIMLGVAMVPLYILRKKKKSL